jgi:hypothetical protein
MHFIENLYFESTDPAIKVDDALVANSIQNFAASLANRPLRSIE